MHRSLVALAAALALAGVVACTPGEPGGGGSVPASPFRACPPAPSAGPSSSRPEGGVAMPPIALPCFTGDAPVRLDGMRRPMVINLWASWCAPCRKELPEFQRFTDTAGDRVGVLGVVTGDTRSAAAALGEDLAVTFPMVFDPASQLQRSDARPALPRAALPVTLLVDAAGGIRHVDVSGALTTAELAALVQRHLGVVVS
jgi:thiol-disulfide isomerase/thioredoxin